MKLKEFIFNFIGFIIGAIALLFLVVYVWIKFVAILLISCAEYFANHGIRKFKNIINSNLEDFWGF